MLKARQRQCTVAFFVDVNQIGRQRTNFLWETGIDHTGDTILLLIASIMIRACVSVIPSDGPSVRSVIPRMKLRPVSVFKASLHSGLIFAASSKSDR